ncbi:hypothetical protein AVEN_166630-1 [Araneus ventricosus]|uniref:Uncharacterized protein n=1 Tax=Araneus ventricosus TaxID=182803 RepID=A0A4Y2MKQ3_ARAVE|nr:hypothetical protein AVEN_166630-1 [Araneus ventricosus]
MLQPTAQFLACLQPSNTTVYESLTKAKPSLDLARLEITPPAGDSELLNLFCSSLSTFLSTLTFHKCHRPSDRPESALLNLRTTPPLASSHSYYHDN